MKSYQTVYKPIFCLLVLLGIYSCGRYSNSTTESDSGYDIEAQIKAIPKSQSLQLFNTVDLTKSYDSILEMKINFESRKKYNFSKAYDVFSNIIHIEIDFSTKQLFQNKKIRSNIIKEIAQLDFTIYKNLKAITLSGSDPELLEMLIEKMAQLSKIELLVLHLKPDANVFWDEHSSINELYVLPKRFCSLSINTLKIQGSRSHYAARNSLLHDKAIPFYASITLPDCFKDTLQVAKIIYEQDHTSGKLKQQDMEQFRLRKKNEAIFEKQTDQVFAAKTVASIDHHIDLVQELLKVKSAEEIVLINAFVDSVPAVIGTLKKLKKLSFLNSEVNYFPKSISSLSALETLKIFNNSTNVYFDKEISGLSNLKNIVFVHTGLSNGFPNFFEAKKLNQLLFLDKNTVAKMPEFLKGQPYLKTLVWRYTNIDSVVDDLQATSLEIVNIDDNKITQLDNILDVAAKASYFSYDINAIPFEKREIYNRHIYPKGQLLESTTLKKELDALYEEREIPLVIKGNIYTREKAIFQNTILNKINRVALDNPRLYNLRRGDLQKDVLVKAIKNKENYGTISFKEDANVPKVFSNSELKLLMRYFDLIEENHLEPLHVFKIHDYHEYDAVENIPTKEFVLENIKNLTEYTVNYTGYEYIDYTNNAVSGDFDYGKLKHLRKAIVSDQESMNNIAKVKGLMFLEIKNIEEITSIPECFCELKELTAIFVRDRKRDKFKNEYVDIRDEIMEERSILTEDAHVKRYKETGDFNQAELRQIAKEYRAKKALRKEMETFEDRGIFDYKHLKLPDCIKAMKFEQVKYTGMIQKN